jgi:hypothetical protein
MSNCETQESKNIQISDFYLQQFTCSNYYYYYYDKNAKGEKGEGKINETV